MIRLAAAVLIRVVPELCANPLVFSTIEPGQVVAELELRSPGSDWAVRGREAAVALVRVNGKPPHQVIVVSGPVAATYRVLLGHLDAGAHKLSIERDNEQSAPGSELQVIGARIRVVARNHADYAVYANAPILFVRKNTVGRFSDVPLLLYCERLAENGRPLLQYTAVFSNEDGGTSTRALMARWGRTTDIEYIYRAFIDSSGRVRSATVQGRDHKELPYTGRREDAHPLLMPVTDNNMVAEAEPARMRFQLAPEIVSLDAASREQVMDDNPLTYQVAAKELEREGKLRPFGVVSGENISDPRNYLHVEYKASHKNSAFAVAVQLNSGRSFSSDLGRLDFAISREGWVRTTVELPPGTDLSRVAAIEFRCIVAPPPRGQPMFHSGECRLERVSKVFLLDRDCRPGPSLWQLKSPVQLRSGESALFRP
jgi:hypothetical protein